MKHRLTIGMLIAALFLFVQIDRAAAQVTVTIRDKSLTEALTAIENESGYSFFYSSALPDQTARINLTAKDRSIVWVLDRLFGGLGISYEIKDDRQIMLSVKKREIKEEKRMVEVTGVVKDAEGVPVIGAGVLVAGTSDGAVTDGEGRYALAVPPDAVLNISFLGYKDQAVAVNGRAVVDVVLREDAQFLDEVVVVGYGVQKKVNLTGSVAMIDSDEMSARPISNVATGLQGLLPGVTVTSASGQPGENGTTIRVRGIGTIGNSNPLVLIDGVEGDLSSINPEDIESVSVLKDAASSAIYGARAANGVLLVTTKRLDNGTGEGKVSVTFGAYFGMQTPTRLPEMCDAVEFMTLDNEARENVGTAKAWQQEHFDKVQNGTDANYFADTDWLGQVLNKFAIVSA